MVRQAPRCVLGFVLAIWPLAFAQAQETAPSGKAPSAPDLPSAADIPGKTGIPGKAGSPSDLQGPTAPIPVDQEADQRGAPVRELTLEDALRIGRNQNVGLRSAELLPEQARMDLLYAEAGFEPELYGNASYGESESPTRSQFQPSTSRTTIDAALGWRQRVATGGLFDLAFRPARYETSGSSAYPDRQYTAEWAASYRQPLLRSAWTDYNLAPINSARLGVNQAQHEFDRTVQDTLLSIVTAYWELAFARENWRVVLSALDVAREQMRITDERIRVGALTVRDRIADESEVARRKEELITAENEIRAREDDLRRLLFDATDPALWQFNLRPASPITVTPDPRPRAFEPLVDVAMAHRPDLSSQRSAVARAEVAQLEANRDALPNLDLVGSWSSDGARDQFHQAWSDATNMDYPDWSVALEFSIPIGNHAARARQQKAALEVERQRRLLHAATLDVTKEVREGVRNLQSLTQSVAASAESVRLAKSNLETEQIKLRVGASTAFEVQRRNQDLSEARSRHLRNQLDYRVAESRLLHAQGILEAPR
jgi:outer membrane protein